MPGVSCPECFGAGFLHEAAYEPTKYPQSVTWRLGSKDSHDHKWAWCVTNRPATQTSPGAARCRTCGGKGNI